MGTYPALTALTRRGAETKLTEKENAMPVQTRGGAIALTLLSTETMVLKNTPNGWRIVHIHWSSRSKK